MTASRTPPPFGRRAGQAAVAMAAAAPRPQPLSEAAERFRLDLGGAQARQADGFAAWRRSRTAGRLAAWLATFALLSPGALCFILQAPTGVSAGVEALGVVAGWWLRRRRRAHLAAIRDWTAGED